MRKIMKKALGFTLAALMTLSLAACSSAGGGATGESAAGQDGTAAQESTVAGTQAEQSVTAESAASGEKIVNVGVTDTLTSLNPLLLNGGEVNKYATGLMFLPLMELDADLNFVPMVADSITTDDNLNFVVHIDEAATWSDGTPITADDVAYTALRLASPMVNNTSMMYYVFEGVGDDGFVEEGAESIEGVQVIDEKTVQFTTKEPMALMTFLNSYARYLLTLPKHVIETFAEDELTTQAWFNQPDVISGPFYLTDFDVDHYVSYTANENYWKGAPKIDKLNIRIVDGSQLYAGLQSGEIDITQQTMSVIPPEDYESVEALENVEVVYGSPITNQSVFIQTANVPDARVRQALLYAIDRQQILEQLLNGHGEVVDGFLSSASPYYDETITPITYDPAKAQELLAEAGWDGSQTLRFYVNSGDSTFVNAATVMAAQWAAVGINVEITTVDFATLMSTAGSMDYDILAVQYTYSPVDPYTDMAWLLGGEGSWTSYSDDEVNAALAGTQTTSDAEELTELYGIADRKMQEDVPMFSAYIISAQGAVSKRLTGATPSVFGFFNDVQNWDVTE